SRRARGIGRGAARASVNQAMAGGRADGPRFQERDGPRDECGVFGLYARGHEVSRLSYFALYALQHRGQESAGIAAADRGGHIITRRELGLVSQVFSENDLRTLAGELAIGHVRYSTTGSNAWENSQPVQRSEGTNGSRRVVAFRDPHGLRPLAIGVLDSAEDDGEIGPRYCVASESCAFDIIGARYLRDVEPGEVVTLGEHGLDSRMVVPGQRRAFCVFEYI